MNVVQELVTGLHVAARAARQPRLWMVLLRTLFSAPVLAALAIPAALFTIALTAMGAWPDARSVVAILAMLVVAAIVLRAWCPPLAQAALGILGMQMAQLQLPSYWRFFAWCAATAAFLAVANKVPVLLPDWILWMIAPLIALVFSAFLVRCMLCVHADGRAFRAVLRRTILRRTLLWFPVSLVPFLLCALVFRLLKGQAWWPGFAGSVAGIWIVPALVCVVLLAINVLILVLWAALSLQALQSVQGPRAAPAAPAASALSQRRPATGWLVATALVLFCVAVAGMNRVALVHSYLRYTDLRYQPVLRSNRNAVGHLHHAIVTSACKGDLAFLKKLMGMNLRPTQEVLSMALDCAVARSHAASATYLLDNDASTFAAFRNAAAARNLPMVRLLVARGAAADRFQSYSQELGMAATNRDVELIKILIDGGAVQDGYSDAGRVTLYEYLTACVPAVDDAASWERVLADAVGAGLELKSKYKKADGVLHFAAGKGYFGLIEALMARGADPTMPGKGGVLPFMQLAAWYPGVAAEPGPGFEHALLALSRGVDNINAPVTMATGSATAIRQENWTIARAAALHRRVRAVLGERIDYSTIGQLPIFTREEAEALMADISDAQLANAPPLAAHWRASRWGDLAQQAQRRQR